MTESKSKGIWGAIKGAIVEETPEAAPAQGQSAPPPVPVPQSVAPPPQRVSKPEVDQEARKRLEASITKAAPPGYVEIMDTVATLADSIPDEGARFRAALKLAAKRGHSLDDLLGDMDKCIGVLEGKKRQFEEETSHQMEAKVVARQKAISGLDEQIRAKQDQMTALQREVSELSEQRGTEAAAITSETANITAVRESFSAAYEVVYAQLQERRQKVSTYGKTVTT